METKLKTVEELKQTLRANAEAKGVEKLGLYENILAELKAIELAAARDFGLPLLELQAAQDMMPMVQSAVFRLTPARRT